MIQTFKDAAVGLLAVFLVLVIIILVLPVFLALARIWFGMWGMVG